jgi:hypothetical protein
VFFYTLFFIFIKFGMAKKKVDRPPVESGEARGMCSGRVDRKVLAHAKKQCRKKYKVGLSSKLEDLLIKEFGMPKP